MSALTLSCGGTSRLGVYKRDLLSGGTSHQQKIASWPLRGENPTTEGMGCMEIIWTYIQSCVETLNRVIDASAGKRVM